ncbi:MAG TPA: hypothetical protein VGT60_13550 [Candidatus Limnocylindria bacterium]|nr:hypothetical protein [Candidatus Limnocylindria bacterium]
MRDHGETVTVFTMCDSDPIKSLVLEEFRLHDAASGREAAEIVARFSTGEEPIVPLLTSIDDRRDVATVRALHGDTHPDPAERAALDPLVASWQVVKRYSPRITERSEGPPSAYRLAVTESGINDAAEAHAGTRTVDADGGPVPIALLWIGMPAGSAGLLVLLGTAEAGGAATPDPHGWPLPLSARLGVRIYDAQG